MFVARSKQDQHAHRNLPATANSARGRLFAASAVGLFMVMGLATSVNGQVPPLPPPADEVADAVMEASYGVNVCDPIPTWVPNPLNISVSGMINGLPGSPVTCCSVETTHIVTMTEASNPAGAQPNVDVTVTETCLEPATATEICVGDHGPHATYSVPYIPVEGTLTINQPIGTSSWSEDCDVPPSTAELHTAASQCPPLDSAATSAPVVTARGVYCGDLIPTGATYTCSLYPEGNNIVDRTGLTIGLDRAYDGLIRLLNVGADLENVITLDGEVYAPVSGYDGVLRRDEGEIAFDATITGPGPTGGISFQNPYNTPARIIAYPTNLDGTAVSVSDVNYIGCGVSTPGIPSPEDYQGELEHTPIGGGGTKAICFCGGGSASGVGQDGTVNAVNGEFSTSYTPLRINAARGMEWAFDMTYRTLSPHATHNNTTPDGDLGFHWDYSYGRHIELGNGALTVLEGNGLSSEYMEGPLNAGLLTYVTPNGRHDTLTRDPLTNETIRTSAEGLIEVWSDGLLMNITDRNGNQISFTYNATGILKSSIDTHNRLINFHHDDDGRIDEISDFAGRSIYFNYCGQLLCRIVGLGNTNVTFSYYGNGLMASITDAEDQTYLENVYDAYNRVTDQRHGDYDQWYRFQYNTLDNETITYDRNGNRIDYHYQSQSIPLTLRKTVFTNRDIDPTEPDQYVTQYAYNKHFDRTRTIFPEGNYIESTFDENNTARRSQGNLVEHSLFPGDACLAAPDPGNSWLPLPITNPATSPQACAPRTTTYVYEVQFNQVTAMTDPRGNDATFIPPNGGITSAARYTTTYSYDVAGNLVQVTHPATHPVGAPEGFSATSSNQTATEVYEYNSYGQTTKSIDAAGTVTTNEYYPSQGSPYNPNDTEGFLKHQIQDVGGLEIQTNYTHDILGEPTSFENAAGASVHLSYDGRCLVEDFEGPPVLGNQDALNPQARRFGQDNVTTDSIGQPIANRTLLAWAISANQTERLAFETAWAALPQQVNWFLLTSEERESYLEGLRIYTNATNQYHRDGIDGTFHVSNQTFYFDAVTSAMWEEGGTFSDQSLTLAQQSFLRSEEHQLNAATIFIGGPAVEDKPLEQRNLTMAAEWALSKASVASTINRDGNGQRTHTVHQTETSEAASGGQRRTPQGMVDETTYNALGNVVRQVTDTTQLVPWSSAGNTTITEFFYDYNENLVCRHDPLRVMQDDWYSIEAWIYNERDLIYNHSRGILGTPPAVNSDVDGACADPVCDDSGFYYPTGSWEEEENGGPLPCGTIALDQEFPGPGSLSHYDGNGNPVLNYDHNGNPTTTIFNGFDEPILLFDALWNRVETSYDPGGRVTDVRRYEAPGQNETSSDLVDLLAHLGLMLPLLGNPHDNGTLVSWTRTSHDERGRQYASSQWLQNTPAPLPLMPMQTEFATTWTERDVRNYVIQSIHPNGHATTATYDAIGRTTKQEDTAGNYIEYKHDEASNVVWERRFENHSNGTSIDLVIEREYDSMGRLINQTDSNGGSMATALNARGEATATATSTGMVQKQVSDASGRELISYYRMGTAQISQGPMNTTFAFPGYEFSLNLTTTPEDFSITVTLCDDATCDTPSSCTPVTNSTCLEIFTTPCAVMDGIEELTYANGCTSLTDDGTLTINFLPASQGCSFSDDVEVVGVYEFPEDLELECYALTWPNFACPYGGTLAPYMDAFICTLEEQMTCSPDNELVQDCENERLCPEMPAPFPPGTMIRPYPGPYWDQHATDGVWDGYSYHFGLTNNQTWDVNSRMTSRVDGEGQAMNYVYDSIGRQLNEVYPDGAETILEYDPNGNVVHVIDPNGNVVHNAYDALNRLVEVNATLGAGTVGTNHQRFEYDSRGHVTLSVDEDVGVALSVVEVHRVYDSRGHVISEVTPGGVVNSTYDAAGNRIGLVYPLGRTIAYEFDELDRMASIIDVGVDNGASGEFNATLATYEYLGSRLAHRSYDNGINRTWSYVDATGNNTLPVRVEDRSGDGTLLVGFEYAHGPGDLLEAKVRMHAPTHSESYGRDAINRLIDYDRGTVAGTTVTSPASSGITGQTWNLTYGNDWASTTSATAASSSTSERDHNARHFLVQEVVGGVTRTYLYDANGNLLSDGELNFTWDFKNRLREVYHVDSGMLIRSYLYDAEGRRVQESTGFTTTRHALDGSRVLQSQNNGEIRSYVYGQGIDERVSVSVHPITWAGPIPIVQPATDYWFLLDEQSSTVAITNATGVILEGYEYTPYGEPIIYTPGLDGIVDWTNDINVQGGDSAIGILHLYTGRPWDAATGLNYYRTRYASPTMGRFISSDTIGVWGDATAIGNGVAYLANRPLDGNDPMGTCPRFLESIVCEPARNTWDFMEHVFTSPLDYDNCREVMYDSLCEPVGPVEVCDIVIFNACSNAKRQYKKVKEKLDERYTPAELCEAARLDSLGAACERPLEVLEDVAVDLHALYTSGCVERHLNDPIVQEAYQVMALGVVRAAAATVAIGTGLVGAAILGVTFFAAVTGVCIKEAATSDDWDWAWND